MKEKNKTTKTSAKTKSDVRLFKKCHTCGHLMELEREVEKCHKCFRAFLPGHYFAKIHNKNLKYSDLFSECHELTDEDLIKGLMCLW